MHAVVYVRICVGADVRGRSLWRRLAQKGKLNKIDGSAKPLPTRRGGTHAKQTPGEHYTARARPTHGLPSARRRPPGPEGLQPRLPVPQSVARLATSLGDVPGGRLCLASRLRNRPGVIQRQRHCDIVQARQKKAILRKRLKKKLDYRLLDPKDTGHVFMHVGQRPSKLRGEAKDSGQRLGNLRGDPLGRQKV